MAKSRPRSLKIIEKFRKNAEKEKERARRLIDKCDKADDANRPALAELVDRLKQKELQASGDIVWAEQQIESICAAGKSEGKSGKNAMEKNAAG